MPLPLPEGFNHKNSNTCCPIRSAMGRSPDNSATPSRDSPLSKSTSWPRPQTAALAMETLPATSRKQGEYNFLYPQPPDWRATASLRTIRKKFCLPMKRKPTITVTTDNYALFFTYHTKNAKQKCSKFYTPTSHSPSTGHSENNAISYHHKEITQMAQALHLHKDKKTTLISFLLNKRADYLR